MQFSREIQRILIGTLLVFILVGISSSYWTIVGPESITLREDNPRIIEEISRIQRGTIYDRDERILAETVTENDETLRRYEYESMYSTIGYYSLRYGEGGVESAFNDALNGAVAIDNLDDYVDQEILNIPQVGTDIQLTLDAEVQDTLVSVIETNRGAGVILNAQTGDILAMASLPTFNPNTLDDDWDTLTEADGNPFFNRALQGQYQPGSVMYTLWLAQAILTRYEVELAIANATDNVDLGDETIVSCVIEPNQPDLTTIQAYQFGCPVPFAVYARNTVSEPYEEIEATFALDNPIVLTSFPIPEPISSTSGTTPEIEIDPSLEFLQDVLGQGDTTVTPLHIAGVMSAIANNGNAPQPNIQLNIRPPDTTDWQRARPSHPSVPMMTNTTARQVRNVMQTNWATIQDDTYPATLTIGANVALSLSGAEAQVWLLGFIRTEQSGHVAFVVVIEDTKEVQSIITIGQELINALINELASS